MKLLTEQIAERARVKSPSAPHANRATVLALRDQIQQALDDRWSVLAIYQTLHEDGHVAFSYQAFRRYVNQIHFGKTSPRKSDQRQPQQARSKGGATHVFGFGVKHFPNKGERI